MTGTEEDTGAELAALWAAVSKMASSLMWRTGQEIVVPRTANQGSASHEAGDGRGDGRDAGNHCRVGDPVQQRTPEQIEDVPLNFGKRQPRWWSWSLVNECNTGVSRKKFWRFRALSPGAHLGAYTDRRCAGAADCERDRRSGGVSPA